MFGNRILYTNSPGGLRRGLVWQSGKSLIKGTTGAMGFNMFYDGMLSNPFIALNILPSGKVFFKIDTSILNTTDFPVNAISLSGNLLPVAFMPLVEWKINNKSIKIEDLSSLVTLDSQFTLQKTACTFTAYDNTTYTKDFMVLYYDISNTTQRTIGTNTYYDIAGDESGQRYEYQLSGVKIIIDTLNDNLFYAKNNIDYMPSFYSNFSNNRLSNLNTLHSGHSFINGVLRCESLQNLFCAITELSISGSTEFNFNPNIFGNQNAVLFCAPFQATTIALPDLHAFPELYIRTQMTEQGATPMEYIGGAGYTWEVFESIRAMTFNVPSISAVASYRRNTIGMLRVKSKQSQGQTLQQFDAMWSSVS